MDTQILLIAAASHGPAMARCLRRRGIELEVDTGVSAARRLRGKIRRFDWIVVDSSLPQSIWCDLLRELRETGGSAALRICAYRNGQLVCGEIITRGGYYAVVPAHEWRPLSEEFVLPNTLPPHSRAAASRSAAA